jgi:hypothetical protein
LLFGFVQVRVGEYVFVILLSPIPELQHAPLPSKVLRARERAPTPGPSVIYHIISKGEPMIENFEGLKDLFMVLKVNQTPLKHWNDLQVAKLLNA